MERMYRHGPAVFLYAPLHTVIWDDPEGSTYFTFDKPSDQFASFANLHSETSRLPPGR
jgi:uncharacterized protein (DUF302 family)